MVVFSYLLIFTGLFLIFFWFIYNLFAGRKIVSKSPSKHQLKNYFQKTQKDFQAIQEAGIKGDSRKMPSESKLKSIKRRLNMVYENIKKEKKVFRETREVLEEKDMIGVLKEIERLKKRKENLEKEV